MKKAFRDTYNDELALLYERAAEFAAEYPGIAERLGGLLQDNTDPGIAGLLEGTAFLAARVQLKQREEFRGFTDELLEQFMPGLLEPLPAMMMVQAHGADPDKLETGKKIPAGSYLDARLLDAETRVACRFRLGSEIELWPLEIEKIAYLGTAAEVSALGQDAAPTTRAALSISLSRQGDAGEPIGTLPLDRLRMHLGGPLAEAVMLYEQFFCNRARISLRWLDTYGDPTFLRLDPDCVAQLGFGAKERLVPHDGRLFQGFAELREGLAFPRKYLGLQLEGLAQAIARVTSDKMQLIFEFDRVQPVLSARLGPEAVMLHAAPAINLFDEGASHVRPDRKRADYIVTPDPSPSTHYEVIRITDVYAHYPGRATRQRVLPLYGLPDGEANPRQALYFTTRRRERRLTEDEQRFGRRARYLGTETFIALHEPPLTDEADAVQRIAIRALCSNRHLTEYLPIGENRDDFHLTEDVTIRFACLTQPTPPREPLAVLDAGGPHRVMQGDVNWRLISYLALGAFGLDGREGPEAGAAGLREMLSLFCDQSDGATARQIRGIEGLATRPVTRMIRRADGFYPARGTEVRITFDEEAWEGSGIMGIGALIDRFLADYAPVNSFTQTVIVSRQRGQVHVWPPRTGSGPLI
ncbi:type VI secretion system protein ImpG [Rhodobacter sp. JA431]|uniref:type VI secretion system baseplate subunit TssF n=1 Tax=Rhodobacter sp. JA431 TaxID=570013 RepID=UPI000BDB7E18|nr:type VI secretion system baseplate subunit TssF [Rhodobacter sp. JA431]SOC10510.1 type VI secretion system protein ImpG [Rhodobacter sp. JA431]